MFLLQEIFYSQVRTHFKNMVRFNFLNNIRIEQGRLDDLISLCYFLAFLVNGKLDWLGNLRNNDP